MTFATMKLATWTVGLATALAPTCGGGGGGSDNGPNPPNPPPVVRDAGAPSGCRPSSSTVPGQSRRTLRWSGGETDFELHIPPSFQPGAPLVIDLHGYTESPDRQDRRSDMRDKSDATGFVLAQPYGGGSSWNGGGVCCGSGASTDRDDVAFIRALVAGLAQSACIDRSRVYVTGFSNGGFLAHRLACEASDLVAAIAPVSGVMGLDFADCRPSRPVPVMHTHGTSDGVVPWRGSTLLRYPSVADTMALWRSRNGCSTSPSRIYDAGNTTCESWACNESSEVVLCEVSGGGHSWPDGGNAINLTDEIWNFFQRH